MKLINGIAIAFFTTLAILALICWLAAPGIVTSLSLAMTSIFAYWSWTDTCKQDS